MREEYEEVSGRKFAILWRKKGNELTDECPFCGDKHVHGTAEGHRVKHCVATMGKRGHIHHVLGFFAKDGTYLAPEDGYVLRNY